MITSKWEAKTEQHLWAALTHHLPEFIQTVHALWRIIPPSSRDRDLLLTTYDALGKLYDRCDGSVDKGLEPINNILSRVLRSVEAAASTSPGGESR